MNEGDSLWLIMMLLGISIPAFTAIGLFMVKGLVDVKERISVLETKADIYHPKDK